jgi:uncharacterized membrane protein YphA (DoxX/SURF4 family)
MSQELLFTGLSGFVPFNPHDLALLVLRLVMGVFFFSYRFRWVYDPSQPQGARWFSSYRRQKLIDRLYTCGFGMHPVLAGTVATIEILAGLGLIVGLLAVPSALGILIIMAFANCCEPPEELREMHPVDKIEYVPDFLKLVEPLYFMLAAVILILGPGRWSFDYLLFGG